MKVWKNPLFPTLNHNTMLTNHDVKINKSEIKLVDDYIVKNNLTYIDLEIFRNIVYQLFERYRADQIVGEYFHDDKGLSNYEKYISFDK